MRGKKWHSRQNPVLRRPRPPGHRICCNRNRCLPGLPLIGSKCPKHFKVLAGPHDVVLVSASNEVCSMLLCLKNARSAWEKGHCFARFKSLDSHGVCGFFGGSPAQALVWSSSGLQGREKTLDLSLNWWWSRAQAPEFEPLDCLAAYAGSGPKLQQPRCNRDVPRPRASKSRSPRVPKLQHPTGPVT